MRQFKCKICEENHTMHTLIESPRPKIFGDVTRGDLNHTLDVVAKGLYVIDRKYGLFQCDLPIRINNSEDLLEFILWIEVDLEHFFRHAMENNKTGKIKLAGKQTGYLPYFDNDTGITFEVEIDLDENEYPKVLNIEKEGELKYDFYNGINSEKLEKIITHIHHLGYPLP